MFWLARLIRLERPIPPTPTAAMFSVSLGGVNPRPRTLLGTMAHAAPPAATSVRKVRREIAFLLLMSRSPREHYYAVVVALRRQVLAMQGTARRLVNRNWLPNKGAACCAPTKKQLAAVYVGRESQKEGGRSAATAKARSRAMPARPRMPSSKRRPIKVMPWGTRRGGENFGRGSFGSGAQSERASATWTKPARSVSEGWPVWLLMVSISSRSEGTRSRSTSEKMCAISCATLRRKRSAWTKSTAERKRDWRKRLGQASGVWTLSWSMPWVRVSSSKAAAPSAKRIRLSEL